MNRLKNKITNFVLHQKTQRVAKRLDQQISFPIKANSIKKVLVILPRNMALLEKATSFIKNLRKSFPDWRVELFDVDKLTNDDLNRMALPKPEILNKLRKANYNFVLDLNVKGDKLSSYIALMTEAIYRLQLIRGKSSNYNIIYQIPNAENSVDYNLLMGYLGKLFYKK